jgi:hypothetical protein
MLLNSRFLLLIHAGKFSLYAEEDTVFQIVAQTRHNVFDAQGIYQDGFSLSIIP